MYKRYANVVLIEFYCIWEVIWGWIPGRIGRIIRKLTIAPFLSYDKSLLSSIWSVEIPEFVHFWEPWNVRCKGYVRFGKYSQINAAGNIVIGEDVMMGPYVMITTVSHNFSDVDTPIRKMKSQLSGVTIGNDVWIGGHCSILPSTVIPDGSVLAAGAVFTCSSGDKCNTVYAGVPAKSIKQRSR